MSNVVPVLIFTVLKKKENQTTSETTTGLTIMAVQIYSTHIEGKTLFI